MFSPDGRKIPPPARLGLLVSRARFASSNEIGLGTVAGSVGIGGELIWTSAGCSAFEAEVRGRDDTGFIKSSVTSGESLAVMASTLAFGADEDFDVGSTMVMGIRRRLGDTGSEVDGKRVGSRGVLCAASLVSLDMARGMDVLTVFFFVLVCTSRDSTFVSSCFKESFAGSIFRASLRSVKRQRDSVRGKIELTTLRVHQFTQRNSSLRASK